MTCFKAFLKVPLAIAIVIVMMSASVSFAQSVTVTDQMVEKAVTLFTMEERGGSLEKGGGGPYELRFKSDIRMHNLGYQIFNYTFRSGDNEVGNVTRITSIIKSSPLDILVRYDDKGRIRSARSLLQIKQGKTPSMAEKEPRIVERILPMLIGADMAKSAQSVNILVTALAQGAKIINMEAPPPLPKGVEIDLRQKILIPGAVMPKIKAKYMDGKVFDTSKIKGKLLLIFTAASCSRCDDMINTTKQALGVWDKKNKIKVAYVIGSQPESAGIYANRLGIKDKSIVEPTDNLSKLLQVPFKPYALMFDKKKLKYNMFWETRELYAGTLFLFVHGRPPGPEDEVKK